ncbi:MAG: hypothetical protein ABI456_12165 [Ktedonobacteraceae bacterium]
MLMNIDASYEKSAELLALARQQGYSISALQLVRWHRAGVLPRPQQRPLKEARGTCSLYPPGTGEQLLLLCSLRARERRLSHLAWQLWLEGYRVEYRIIRTQLQQATIRISHWMQWFVGFKRIYQQDTERALNLIERYAEGPLRSQPLRRIRKRIGREHFSTFLSLLLELTAEDKGEIGSIADEYERQLDLRILARGLGLEKRFVSRKDALEYYLVQFLLPQLHWFFRWSQEARWEELLEHVADFEVFQARDDLCTWLMRLGNGRQYQDRLPDDYPRWEMNLQEIFRALSPADQALVLVAWLALRTLPSFWLDEMPAIIIGPDGPSYSGKQKL